MNLQTGEGATDAGGMPTSEMVAEYLRAHPNFFSSNPDVLRDIEITHAAGDAVSLLERQVSTLRNDNERMKTRFEELVSLAKSNEDLIKRIHQLALALMEAAGPEAIFATLTERLAREFDADRVRTLIFADPSFVDSKAVPEFVGSGSSVRKLFAEALKTRAPKCGGLTESQTRCLYGDTASVGSAALLPLCGKAWDGLLVISSDDEGRFNEHMGTDFLAYLGDIVSLIVDPWVTRG
jgi:uncharacterized protein YigA (DUF484 family)